MLGAAVRSARARLVPALASSGNAKAAAPAPGAAAWSRFAAVRGAGCARAFVVALDPLAPLAGISGAQSLSHWAALLASKEHARSCRAPTARRAPARVPQGSIAGYPQVPRFLVAGSAGRSMSSTPPTAEVEGDKIVVYKSAGMTQLQVITSPPSAPFLLCRSLREPGTLIGSSPPGCGNALLPSGSKV